MWCFSMLSPRAGEWTYASQKPKWPLLRQSDFIFFYWFKICFLDLSSSCAVPEIQTHIIEERSLPSLETREDLGSLCGTHETEKRSLFSALDYRCLCCHNRTVPWREAVLLLSGQAWAKEFLLILWTSMSRVSLSETNSNVLLKICYILGKRPE